MPKENIDVLGRCFLCFGGEGHFFEPTEDDVVDSRSIKFIEKINDVANLQLEFPSPLFRFAAAGLDPKKVDEVPGAKHTISFFAVD